MWVPCKWRNRRRGPQVYRLQERQLDERRLCHTLGEEKEYISVENLVRESFWNVYRPGCSEHYVIHVLRNDPAFVKELDFVSNFERYG